MNRGKIEKKLGNKKLLQMLTANPLFVQSPELLESFRRSVEQGTRDALLCLDTYEQKRIEQLAQEILPQTFADLGVTNIQPKQHLGQTCYLFTANSPGNKEVSEPDLVIKVDREGEVARSREHALWWEVPAEERAKHGIMVPLIPPREVATELIEVEPSHATVEPYFKHTTLEAMIKNLTTQENGVTRTALSKEIVGNIFTKVAETLAFTHNVGWLTPKAERRQPRSHRDLHPANILIGENKEGQTPLEVRVCDWGNGVRIGDRARMETTSLGSRHYTSPTVHAVFNPNTQGSSPQDDIYAFGASMYKAITGRNFGFFDPSTKEGVLFDAQNKPISVLNKEGQLDHAEYEATLDHLLNSIPHDMRDFKHLLRRCLLTRDTVTGSFNPRGLRAEKQAARAGKQRYSTIREVQEDLKKALRPSGWQTVYNAVGNVLCARGGAYALTGALALAYSVVTLGSAVEIKQIENEGLEIDKKRIELKAQKELKKTTQKAKEIAVRWKPEALQAEKTLQFENDAVELKTAVLAGEQQQYPQTPYLHITNDHHLSIFIEGTARKLPLEKIGALDDICARAYIEGIPTTNKTGSVLLRKKKGNSLFPDYRNVLDFHIPRDLPEGTYTFALEYYHLKGDQKSIQSTDLSEDASAFFRQFSESDLTGAQCIGRERVALLVGWPQETGITHADITPKGIRYQGGDFNEYATAQRKRTAELSAQRTAELKLVLKSFETEQVNPADPDAFLRSAVERRKKLDPFFDLTLSVPQIEGYMPEHQYSFKTGLFQEMGEHLRATHSIREQKITDPGKVSEILDNVGRRALPVVTIPSTGVLHLIKRNGNERAYTALPLEARKTGETYSWNLGTIDSTFQGKLEAFYTNYTRTNSPASK